jgi:hypothetical protein
VRREEWKDDNDRRIQKNKERTEMREGEVKKKGIQR